RVGRPLGASLLPPRAWSFLPRSGQSGATRAPALFPGGYTPTPQTPGRAPFGRVAPPSLRLVVPPALRSVRGNAGARPVFLGGTHQPPRPPGRAPFGRVAPPSLRLVVPPALRSVRGNAGARLNLLRDSVYCMI